MIDPVLLQLSSSGETFSTTDFLGVIFTALSISLPILLFLMKSFSDQIDPKKVLEHDAGSEAWEIAMVDAEEGITMIKALQQGIMILVFAILYILLTLFVNIVEIQFAGPVLALLGIPAGIAVGLVAFLIVMIIVTYLSVGLYRSQKRKHDIISSQRKARNRKISDFTNTEGNKEKETREETQREGHELEEEY